MSTRLVAAEKTTFEEKTVELLEFITQNGNVPTFIVDPKG